MWVVLVTLKVFHEFGHAYACKRFGGVVAADDVNFSGTGLFGIEHALTNHRVGKRVGFGIFQVRAKRTKLAAVDANIGRVQVNVGVEISKIPVLSFPNTVRHASEGEHVDFFIQKKSLLEREPLARVHFFDNLT